MGKKKGQIGSGRRALNPEATKASFELNYARLVIMALTVK